MVDKGNMTTAVDGSWEDDDDVDVEAVGGADKLRGTLCDSMLTRSC